MTDDQRSAPNLAAAYRPHKFGDVVGHHHVVTLLKRAIAADQLPAQLLFSGPSGLGKTTLARICAAALLCEDQRDGDACGECSQCVDIWSHQRTHPDVVEFDAASNGNKDQIKELALRASTAPASGRWRIYIIDEAHGLSSAGGQAFLKLLEEPPSHVIFILCTTDPDKMLRTNRGRCVELTLAQPDSASLAAHLNEVALSEGVELEDGLAAHLVQATDPALGIRGQINALQRAIGLIQSGVEPSVVAASLGVVTPEALTAITDAIENGDGAAAVTSTAALRSATSESAVRRALTDWAYTSFVEAAAQRKPLALHLKVTSTFASAPTGSMHTDVAVAFVAELHEPQIPAATAPIPEATTPVPAAEQQPKAAASRPTPHQDNSKATQRPAEHAESASFIASVAALNRSAAAPLGSLSLTFDNESVTINVGHMPAPVVERHLQYWKDAALPLTVTLTS